MEKSRKYIEADNRRLKAISELLPPQARVLHQVFGPGTVLSVNLRDCCYEIKFDRLDTPRMIRFTTHLEEAADLGQ